MPSLQVVSQYRLRSGDVIAGFVVSSLATVLRASFRVVYDDGTDDELIVPDFTTVATRTLETLTTETRAKKDGYVVGGVVISVSTLPKRGQTYVVFWIAKAVEGVNVKDQLIGDYLYGLHTPSLGNIVDPGPGGGEGFLNFITTANPAAGAEVDTITVPTNAMWRPLAYKVTLAQGITQTPRPGLTFVIAGGGDVGPIVMGADLAASTTVELTWVRGIQHKENNVDLGSMVAPMPETFLRKADSIVTETQGIGAGTDYGVATLWFEEWLAI